MFSNHVRRNPAAQTRYSDGRIPSNPQAIPRNSGLASIQRGSVAPSNFPYNARGHSPHYVTPSSIYPPVNSTEMNSNQNQVAPSPSTKQPANGQIVWGGQRIQYAAQTQHPSNQHQNAYQPSGATKYQHVQNSGQFQAFPPNSSNMMSSPSQYVFVRAQRFPNAPHSVVTQAHPSMPSASSGYYQPQSAYYPSQIPPVQYTPSYEQHMSYQPGSQPTISAPVMQPHPTPSQSMPPPKKKPLKIINPDTMQEVDVVRSGARTESESSSHSRASPPATTHPQDEHRAVQVEFASKVAAAATDATDKPRKTSSSTEVQPIVNIEADSSKPQKSNRNSNHGKNAAAQTPKQDAVATNGVVASESKKISNGTTQTSAPLSKPAAVHPATPMAVVHPLSHAAPPKPVDVTSKPPVPRVEKILSRGEALPPLKDSKDAGAIAPPVEDEVFEPSKSTETISFECAIEPETNNELSEGAKTSESIKNPSSSNEELSRKTKEVAPSAASNQSSLEKDVLLSKEGASENETSASKTLISESSKVVSEPTKISFELTETASDSLNFESEKVAKEEPPKTIETTLNSDSTSVPLQTKTEQVVEEGSKVDSKALSGGDPAVKESTEKLQNKPPTPEVTSKLEERKPDVIQNIPPAKLPSSRDEALQKEAAKPELILRSESAERKKVQYERDFLIKCRDHESTREKPSLPNLPDIVMEQCLSHVSTSLPSLSGGYGGGTDFTPGWMVGRNPRMERQTSRGSQGGSGRQGGYYPQQQQKVIKKVSIQREPEPELNKAENAWKPSKLEGKPAGANSSEEEQTADILKNVRAILNKLTPQKFTPLMQKFRLLPINTENRLREVINLVFEKAIDEPNFCEAYANMCRVMSQYRVSAPGGEGGNSGQGPATSQVVVFRKVLLTRCQKEFEKDRTSETNLIKLRQKVEEAKTEEEKKLLNEELEYAESKERRRIMGNIRFIGELFKLNMLTEQIMHNCIMSLFKARDEESLESLCKLLTTIGMGLDHVKGKHLMDQYFSQIDKIISERKISSRVKFMLIDVKDLRKNNWVQRAIKAQGPKTIAQIHQDAKEEKEQMVLKASASSGKLQSRGNRLGSRNSSSHNLSEDGWQNVSAQKPMRIDPQKMKFSKIDESNVTLGPNRGKQMWKSGSGSITTKTGSGGFSHRDADGVSTPRSVPPNTMNRFSALSTVGSQETFYPNRQSGRVSSQERSKSGSRGSGRDERQNALDTVRRLTSAERKPPSTGAPPVTKPSAFITEANDAVLKKLDSIIIEYLHLRDIEEATECFDELRFAPTLGHVIVKACLEGSLEKLSNDRANISKLLCSLIKNDKVKPDQYVKGVAEIMELAVDLELDLPKVWSCIAELIAGSLHATAGKIDLVNLKEMAFPLLEFQRANLFFAEVLKRLITEQKDSNKVLQDWRDSKLQIEYFLQTNDPSAISAFLNKHGLRAFYGAADLTQVSENSTASRLNFDKLVSELSNQLEKHSSDDLIYDWIESTTTKTERLQPVFQRALVTAVCNKAIIQSDASQLEVQKELVTSRSNLLRKFLDDETKELQAVYALQRLFVALEQPPNVLKHLFDFLYDEEVISEQTFFDWEKSNDSNELEGKGVALLSVNPFLTWLRQAEVESDE